MSESKRNEWESRAIATASGSIGTALAVTFGAPAWLAGLVYVVFAVVMIVWANWRYDAEQLR